jgi:GH15 family glucan-1,4-alpha-glucosidase
MVGTFDAGPTPIDDYGLIGDTRTAALVSSDGAIDWMCAPHFDSDPLFGRLVGGADAGTFRVGPLAPATVVARRYREHTATLETIWRADGASLAATDAMVAELGTGLMPPTLLVRELRARDGPVDVTIVFDPRVGDAHLAPRTARRGSALVCSWGPLAVALAANRALTIEPGRPCTTTVEPGAPLLLVLSVAKHEPLVHVAPDAASAAVRRDEAMWRAWCDTIDATIPCRDAVVRSLLTLRLLTYSPSGAPVAAPTTSLPEAIGGVRNWDYRFAWPRDASIGIGAFLGVGKADEARSFLGWLLHASRLDRPRLPVLLTLHGKHPRPERTLRGWPGYAGSRPVRVGNGAADQHQLDNYGWVLDAAWLVTRAGERLSSEAWRAMAGFADHVAAHWREPDAGIWEIRGDGQHHVHSKLMAWLALDRALRIAGSQYARHARTARWQAERDALRDEVRVRGFDPVRGTYRRSYETDELDAALLVLPLLGVEAPTSPRVRATIDAVARELDAGAPLLYRYIPGRDGLPGEEGAFLPCAFWLVQALAATGRVDEAADRLHALVELATPLGLYAEEMDPTSRAHLGNYPQALTHATLVQAALALRDACARAHRSPRRA